MSRNLRSCPGCGVLLPEADGPTHRYIGASPECWAAFGAVSEKEYGDFRYARVHGLTVDAYCAQHPGEPSPQAVRSVAVHLVGLFLQMERDLRPEDLYAVHRRTSSLAKEGKDVFWMEPPAFLGETTILYVLDANRPDEHAGAGARVGEVGVGSMVCVSRDHTRLGGALIGPGRGARGSIAHKYEEKIRH